MSQNKSRFLPEANASAVEHLFVIEVGLRLLILDRLSTTEGNTWYKSRLPSDVIKKYKMGMAAEKECNWTSHVPHNPIFYTDFPDIVRIIESKNCWAQVFAPIFTNKKEVIVGALRSIEHIRNKAAHNRVVTASDLDKLSSVREQLVQQIGDQELTRLFEKHLVTTSIVESLEKLANEFDVASESISNLAEAQKLQHWEEVNNSWWFDDEILNGRQTKNKLENTRAKLKTLKEMLEKTQKEIEHLERKAQTESEPLTPFVEPLRSFFSIYQQYLNTPRVRGQGHKLESEFSNLSTIEIIESARVALRTIKENAK